MLDVSVAYHRYKFLGYEYLTWLWFVMERDEEKIRALAAEAVSLEIGNRIVLENKRTDAPESITITGGDAGLEEGKLALRKGAIVTELNLFLKAGEHQWQFTLKGDGLHFASFKTPPTGPTESRDDLEGAVLEKAYLYDKAIQCMDELFKTFIILRVSDEWHKRVVPRMKQWMHA